LIGERIATHASRWELPPQRQDALDQVLRCCLGGGELGEVVAELGRLSRIQRAAPGGALGEPGRGW